MTDPSSAGALSGGAAVVAGAGRAVVGVGGADRASWLQGLVTNDIVALAPGRGCYTAWLTPQGRMVTDAIVLAGADRLTVEVPAVVGDQVYGRLDAAIFAEDVQLDDQRQAWTWIGAHGTAAAAIVARALAAGDGLSPSPDATVLSAWPEYAHLALPDGGRLFRHDSYGAPGFVFRVAPDAAAGWSSRLREAGAVAVAAADLEWARIEAGRPEFGVDMRADTIPLEAGIEERAISFTKGCYVGQEVIVRVVHRGGGRVARRLVGLRVAGARVPAAGAPIRQAGQEVGTVTSAAHSPRLGHPVALGYVRRELVEPGAAVTIDCDGTTVPATVSALPIG
ncbi:MAG: folate-binding protein YgfZ [Vicinamibacterales bacterium]